MPSGQLRKYAPDDVVSSVGAMSVTGVKEGTFIEIDRQVDGASLEIGSDGEATMTISPNQSGTVKYTLQQSSPVNEYFTSLYLALQNKDTTNGVKALSVKDANGTTIATAAQAFVQKVAKVTFADKTEGREWTFLCPYLVTKPGSNVVV